MSSSVEQIKNKIDIVSLVSSYMKLERSGQNWKGKCPFHNEKTPSFFVSPDRGSYYCFGCQAKGDIFNFVQEFEGLDFVGALKVLADRAGVKLEYHDRNEQGETERLHSVMEKAVFFYQKKLSENPAVLKYLKSRGVENETIKKFRIGYAPDEWRSLSDHLISSGNKKQDLLAAGLVKVPEVSPEKIYDTFRGRIMFPINDSSGRPIAFSGRTLSSDPKIPKYLNSPETILFNKSETLFGLDHAKKSIRIEDFSILVEGQMDLIMLHQIGFSNSVASSGTALTAEHLVKLRRLSNKIVMSFDGDSAGFKAADRSAKIALSLGMDLKLAFLPEGKDPADMALSDPEKLKESIRSAKHIIDFYTDSLLQKGLEPRALGSEIEKNVLPYVARLPSAIERDNFIRSISRKTFIREDALWKDLERVSAIPEGAISENKKNESEISSKRSDSIERRIVGMMIWQKSLEDKTPIDFGSLEKRFFEASGGIEFKEASKKYEKENNSMIFEAESYFSGAEEMNRELGELFSGMEEETMKNKFAESMVLLQKAEQSGNSADILKYLEECQRISQRIDLLKKASPPVG